MNIELVKYYIPFMQALADGKEVEVLIAGYAIDKWTEWDGIHDYTFKLDLRIKEEPLVFYGNLVKNDHIRNLSAYSNKNAAANDLNARYEYELIAQKFVQVIDE